VAEHYIGLMSGTSLDGVDAVLARFPETDPPRLLASHRQPMPEALREALLRLMANRSPHPLQCLGELDHLLGALFAEATENLLEKAGMETAAVRAIGSHGQTVWHRPTGPNPFTLQIGDPNLIAERSGITTVADFRRRDMAAGGQGAPLAPTFHAAYLHSTRESRAVLNLGGMANLTCLPLSGSPCGFDTGPANVLLDLWAGLHLGAPFDAEGRWAASGTSDPTLLSAMLEEPYFHLAPPKSTGREQFNLTWMERHLADRPLAPADVQATLLELTARSVADALAAHAPATRRLLVCGGGIHNGALMERLAALLPGTVVESTACHGIDPDWLEALAFAWLARETLAGRPGNLPTVTGAGRAVVLGGVYPGGR